MAELSRLRDDEVERLVERADDLLGRLEEVPGPAGELALAAVTALTDLYAEALGRVVDHARGSRSTVRALTDDALVGHLLALHGVHPDPVEQRVARALDRLRHELASLGRDLTLAGLADGVAEVVLGGHGGCGGGGPSVEELSDLVRDVVVGAAPELVDVRVIREHATTFVPLESLVRTPAGAQGPAR
jgi:hypothetical protein